jgi:hypothetical protein
MSKDQLAIVQHPRASEALAAFIGMDQAMMLETIKAQCFRTRDKNGNAIEVTDFQLAAFISIAHEMKVNPLLPGIMYAYPNKQGGVTPILGPDGVFKKLSEREDIDGWEVKVFPEDVSLPPTHAIATIYRKGSQHPISYTAILSEWRVQENPNWASRPRHMLQLRALKHAARQVIHGMPGDEDDRLIAEVNVTPGAPGQEGAPAEERPDPAALRKRGRPAKGTQAEAPKGEVIDVTPEPEPQKPAEQPTPPPGAAHPPAGTPPSTSEETGTLVPLKDKTKYTLKGVKVVSSEYENYPKDGKARHGAKGVIQGHEYSGPFIHLAGGRAVGTGDGIKHEVIDAWKPGTVVTLEIRGAFSPSKKKVLCMVDSVAVEAQETEEEGAP